MYAYKIIADSISDRDHRLTSFLVTYPRIIHSEFLTHSMLVRNSESSRARPVRKNIDDVIDDPFVPDKFGKNQSGMQWVVEIPSEFTARQIWIQASRDAVISASELAEIEVHKSLANRILEPYKWHTALYTGTDWSNFFALRTHPDAQPEFQTIARMMRETYDSNEPRRLSPGEWHLPFVEWDEIDTEARTYPEPWIDWPMWINVSAGRCARLSYLTHDGKRDRDADIKLATERLIPSGHMSPFGHQARPFRNPEWNAIHNAIYITSLEKFTTGLSIDFLERMHRNLEYCAQFRGWWQARADIPNESDFQKVLDAQVV